MSYLTALRRWPETAGLSDTTLASGLGRARSTVSQLLQNRRSWTATPALLKHARAIILLCGGTSADVERWTAYHYEMVTWGLSGARLPLPTPPSLVASAADERPQADQVVIDQEIAVHMFAYADGPEADAGWQSFEMFWARCQEAGLTEPVPGLGLSAEPPQRRARPRRSAVLAVCQTPDVRSQAILRVEHNVLVASLLVKAPDRTWAAFEPELAALVGDPEAPGVFSRAQLYLGKVADPATASWAIDLTPGPSLDRGIDADLGSGVRAWLLDDARTTRRMVVLAPPCEDLELGRWTWSDTTPAMPALARYLMHVAKLRHQMRVHAAAEGIHALCDTVEGWVTRLIASDEPDPIIRRRLGTAVTKAALVASELRRMRRNVEIARHNAAQALGQVPEAEPTSGRRTWFGDDQALARSFLVRLDDDLAYLENQLTTAREVDGTITRTT
ncbi:CATRA conflict system CASPASE/TPR repeat-associated protein [Amycolatopsis sp. NPDC026612]|uniref:CATRA conflict system CASPASE/TPR repeat-associated protein n=1 Tax=Amycolatopsis sp. NPDC026612 TaxID=3155466 RepID=UPI0033D22BFE